MVDSYSKIFDSAFRTVATKAPETMIPLTIELFGPDDIGEGIVVNLQEIYPEHYGLREADAVFALGWHVYHFECQAASDSRMPVRMLEYDFAIGRANVGMSRLGYELAFPRSCVVHLRGKTTLRPQRVLIAFASGRKITYRYRDLWLSDYTIDDIFSRRLYALLPFWPVRIETEIDSAISGNPKADKVLAELGSILPRLAADVGENSLVYNVVGSAFVKVGRHVIPGNDDFSKKARSVMGGEVWELPFEKAERIAREAEERGMAKGMEKGEAKGASQARDAIAANMRALGIDETIIAKAIAI